MDDFTPEQQQQVEDLLEQVLAVEKDLRKALLDSAMPAPLVREEVESLMAYHPAALDRLETANVSPDVLVQAVDQALASGISRDQLDPTTVGPYTIIEKLGEGGMGTVYLAEQKKPLRRRVALKLIKLGMDTRSVVARFEVERQALALMNHPNVAMALDAGSTEDGRPYFVMEYVEGVRITEFCDTNRLDVSARLTLFGQVCAAIQHAHQKGVVHRDIKPSNVIVCQQDGSPHPKVIDFGVAKATNQPLTERTLFTERGVLIGTPEYMSPEQAKIDNSDVDTRSDIYSLGVLLYELLVGALPLDADLLRSVSHDEIHRLVRDYEPSKPSTHLTGVGGCGEEAARNRGTDVRTLRRHVRGDLEWIVMKCLEKNRDRRYATVGELIDDIKRYLHHEPVMAGPPTLSYRIQKFVRRNRALVYSVSTIFAFLLAATITIADMYAEALSAKTHAEIERAIAHDISEFVQDMLHSIDPEIARGRDVSVLREVLDGAAARLDAKPIAEPRIAKSLHETIGRAYQSIGQNRQAERHLRAALTICNTDTTTKPLDIASATSTLGNLLRQMSQFEEAESLLRNSLSLRRRETGTNSLEVAEALLDLAILLDQIGADECESSYRDALEIHRHRESMNSSTAARTLHGLAVFLDSHNRLNEAEQPYRQALEIQRNLMGDNHPNVIPMQLGVGYWLRRTGRYELAEEQYLIALQICRENLTDEHPKLLNVLSNLAALYQDMGRYESAEPIYRETLEIERRVHGEQHVNVATTTNNLASLLFTLGRMEEAETLFRQAATAYRKVLGADHYWVSISLNSVARIREAAGDYDETEKIIAECLRIRRVNPNPSAWAIAELETIRGACLTARKQYTEAERALLVSLEDLQKHYPDNKRVIKDTRRRLAKLYTSWGRPENAAQWRSTLSD